MLHVEDGIHRLLTLDERSGEVTATRAGSGSYGDPDVASQNDWYASSWLAADGTPRVFEQDWTAPPRLLALAQDGTTRTIAESAPAPAGRPLASTMIGGSEGTPVQLWWALPEGQPAGTVLSVHGGPNLVTVDRWDPSLQAWLDEGFAVAALNYHGSVTFGRDLREGFWGRAGDAEVADVAAALAFLREQGAADPASTFITGASYGGHLSLLSLGRLPDQFAGALGEVAMADWRAAIGDMNPAIRVSWINFLTSPSRVTGERLELEPGDRQIQPDRLGRRRARPRLAVAGQARHAHPAGAGAELRRRAAGARRRRADRVVRRRPRAGRLRRPAAGAAADAGAGARRDRRRALERGRARRRRGLARRLRARGGLALDLQRDAVEQQLQPGPEDRRVADRREVAVERVDRGELLRVELAVLDLPREVVGAAALLVERLQRRLDRRRRADVVAEARGCRRPPTPV